jgi:hypothetical protein
MSSKDTYIEGLVSNASMLRSAALGKKLYHVDCDFIKGSIY